MELPDPKYLVSHVGHDMQRFDKKRWSRLLSSAVVMRTNEQGQHQIVFLSSSNPKKGDFLLPKGGWDKGEDIKKAALGEVIEEVGVNAQLAHGLGKVKFEDAGKKYTYFAYLMKANKIYDDWAESIRYRLWVLLDEAEVMLARRGQKVKVVKRAMAVNPFVDTHLGDCAKRFDERGRVHRPAWAALAGWCARFRAIIEALRMRTRVLSHSDARTHVEIGARDSAP
ncbi:hypothetical protein PC118_g10676 [Phytophthora cactorum]|uniref:Nudix hydrolase domain-containing protein n=1 Tax=Phytophthora cactorum TaxID=29920 RepID=A0A8T1FW92_9STRA|nr:hypothetical protein PC118_g10676 [Phytophthora cactorum]